MLSFSYYYIFVIIIFCFYTLAFSNSCLVTNNYFRAGNEDVISTLTGSDANPVPSYTFTFSSALTGVPELGYGIKNYEGDDYLAVEQF